MKKFDIDEANQDLENIIQKILIKELPILKNRIEKLCEEVKKAKYIIYAFSISLFIVGIFFLIVALSLTFLTNGIDNFGKLIESLGFGSASGTSFVSLMLLNPIKKIRDANSDASQAEMIYQSWEMGVLLYIRAMDINNRETIKEAAEKIKNLTEKSIELIESYTET